MRAALLAPLHNQRGVALLLVLVVTSLLALLISELAFSTLVDLRLAQTQRDSTQASYLARGGLQLGRSLLSRDTNSYDGADELWAQGLQQYPVGDFGLLSLQLQPLDGRINLNRLIHSSGNTDAVVKDQLLRLFELLGLDQPHQRVDALIDWLDADDIAEPAGAESSFYARRDPPLRCRNGPLETVAELALVEGFSTTDIERLRPHVDVKGDSRLHLNSASAEVLCALCAELDIERAEQIVRRRQTQPFRQLEELQQLPRWEDFYWALSPQLKTRAVYYRIDSQAQINQGFYRIEAIVQKDNDRLLRFRVY